MIDQKIAVLLQDGEEVVVHFNGAREDFIDGATVSGLWSLVKHRTQWIDGQLKNIGSMSYIKTVAVTHVMRVIHVALNSLSDLIPA